MNDIRNAPLAEVDPIVAQAIDSEVARQANGLELIIGAGVGMLIGRLIRQG